MDQTEINIPRIRTPVVTVHGVYETHTLLCSCPRKCHWCDIDGNLVRLQGSFSFWFISMGCLMNLKCAKRQCLGRVKGPDMRRVWTYGCRKMTQIKTEKTIMADYTVIKCPSVALYQPRRWTNRRKTSF